jgi:hypothetical protein
MENEGSMSEEEDEMPTPGVGLLVAGLAGAALVRHDR